MKTDFDKIRNEQMIDDPMNYKWGIFYFNKKDRRIMVPKRSKSMGWTMNFANIYSYIILILIFGLIAASKKLYS
jgi:uncharacterized membrane protein